MQPLKSEFLMTLEIELETTHVIGETPAGTRRIDIFKGGRFEGPRLRGKFAAGGADMILRRADGAMQPDVRLTLETDDGAFIQVTYRGVRHGPEAVMQRIAQGEEVTLEVTGDEEARVADELAALLASDLDAE